MNSLETLSLTATLPNASVMQKQSDQALEMATEFVIDCDPMYEIAAEELKEIKTKIAKLTDQRMSITRPMDEAKKRIMDLFRSPVEVLEKAAKQLETAMLNYQAEKRRIAQEAQRQLELRAREEQRKLQEQAALEKQKADAERKALLEQAEQEKQNGNLAAAAILEAQSENTAMQAELTVSALEAAANIATAPVVIEEKPTAKGVSTRDNFKAEVTDRIALVKYVAEHPEHIELLMANMPEINKRAKALKNAMNIPGVRVYNEPVISTRR